MQITGETKEGSPDYRLELPFSYAHGRKAGQLTRFEIQLLSDPMILLKNIEELPVRNIEVFAESMVHDDHPARVAAIVLLDRLRRTVRDRAFRLRYEASVKRERRADTLFDSGSAVG